MPTEALEIVNRLESLYAFVIDEVASNEVGLVIVRSDIPDAKGALLFVKELEKITDSKFVLRNKVKRSLPFIYHKHWVCQHSTSGKSTSKKFNTTCKASVEILIKRVDENTVQEDNFLTLENPLPCIIKLYLVHTHYNNITEELDTVNVNKKNKYSETHKDSRKSSCYFGKFERRLHCEEEYADEMYATKLDNYTVLNDQTKISKRKILSPVLKKERKKVFSSNNVNYNFESEQNKFSYIHLTNHLEQVQKPNSRWTVSSCQEYIICAKWDVTYFNEWKVVVCQDLTAKVFLKDKEVPSLGIKIHSIENLSSLLLAVNELDICEDIRSGDL